MAATPTAHAHLHRPAISRQQLAFGWPHRVAAGLLVLVGAAFVAVTLSANLFQVGPAFDRLTDDFRPIMSQKALQTDQQDIDTLAAAGAEIQTQMLRPWPNSSASPPSSSPPRWRRSTPT